MRTRALMVLGFVVCASCGESSGEREAPAVGDAACDNLDESACIFPFPSDFFRRAGGPFGQAFHLDFGAALPANDLSGERMDPEAFKVHDGYPVVPAITFTLEGASLAGAPALEDIGASVRPESRIQIVDAESGERMPHWAELDYLAEDAGKRIVQLRVADALRHDRRYVVIVRGLVDDAGKPVAAGRGFTALRDAASTPLAGIDERRAHFEEKVFPVIERAGVPRAEVQLAWDFTTTSEKGSIGRLLAMRDRLYDAVGDEGPAYAVDRVVTDPDGPTGTIARIIEATAQVPSFMLPPEILRARRLRLDAGGLPAVEGFESVKFRVQVPRVALDPSRAGKVAVMQYGHGFLGSDEEANNGWLREWANRHGFLILSCDMQGMNTPAGALWFARLPEDATTMAHIAEEPLQGIINHLALQRLMKGRFLADPNVQRAGEPLYDPARLYYHGNSQGGTMGNLVVLPSRDVTRAILGVPGVSIGFILARASQWEEMSPALSRNYGDPFAFAAVQSLVQVGWDKTDAINFAPLWATLPDTPPKQVLLQTGLEDSQVNNDVTRLLARLYRAKLVAPAPREIFGLEAAASPIVGANAYQEIDFAVAPRTRTNRPASKETDTHGKPRKLTRMQDQGWQFLETGEIHAVCDGVCDPD
ncbi:MAG: hypothetical protein KF819_35045 [Labilithrix sp.]|nr:hypothetical protein [Labilithrix sp.]